MKKHLFNTVRYVSAATIIAVTGCVQDMQNTLPVEAVGMSVTAKNVETQPQDNQSKPAKSKDSSDSTLSSKEYEKIKRAWERREKDLLRQIERIEKQFFVSSLEITGMEKRLDDLTQVISSNHRNNEYISGELTERIDGLDAEMRRQLNSITSQLTEMAEDFDAQLKRFEGFKQENNENTNNLDYELEQLKAKIEGVQVALQGLPAAAGGGGLLKEDPEEARELSRQARQLAARRDYPEAELLAQQALEKREEALGGRDPRVALSLNDLGLINLAQGKLDAAELLIERALAIYRETAQSEADVATTMNNLAKLREAQGNVPDAEALYREALSVFENTPGDNDRNISVTLSNLGAHYKARKDYVAAESVFKQGLKLRRRLYGKDHPKVAMAMNNLGLLYMEWGKDRQCEEMLKEALEIYEGSSGVDDRDAAAVIRNLELFYRKTGRDKEAESLTNRAVQILDDEN